MTEQPEPSPESLAEMPEVDMTGARRGWYALKIALAGEHPITAMRDIAIAQLAHGVPRESVMATFEALRAEQRAADNEELEECVMTVMDHLYHWGNPKYHI